LIAGVAEVCILVGGIALSAVLLNQKTPGTPTWSNFVVLVALWFGGLEVIRLYTLRFMLWRQGHMPSNYARFLDHCVDLIFLRRVGGGYIFIHRYLLEYFAALEPEK
jgi:hypothetical protein